MQYVAFDIETTGFLPRVDQIVEIAAVRFRDGRPLNSFSSLVNPKIPMPVEAMRVHGINDDMLRDQPHIDNVLDRFADFCGEDVMVAHNAPFDLEFIKADVEKHEVKAPRGVVLDTCAMARKAIPGSANYRLGTLVSFLKIPIDGQFHRAEADARFCGHLFSQILQRIYRPGETPVLENLVNLSGGQPMRFPQVTKSYRQLDFLAQL